VATAAQQWAADIEAWRTPEHILEQAPQSPWVMPDGLSRTEPAPTDTPSRDRAIEAIPPQGRVLDVGCGAGRASFAVAPPADHLVGVDTDPRALAAYAAMGLRRGLTTRPVRGTWPDAAGRVPAVDVALAHHVAYTTPDLVGAAAALSAVARRRVVMELQSRFPMGILAPLWERFWDLPRPAGPTAALAIRVLAEAGIAAEHVEWEDRSKQGLQVLDRDERVVFARSRLCLPATRDREIAKALTALDIDAPRRVTTIWWDPSS
jgi:SAM-dependent methyltransferase